MSTILTGKIRKRGTLVIPAELRRRLGLEEDSIVAIEERDRGILIRPAVVVPVEVYSPERRAEFLLANAIDDDDYLAAAAEVQKMGLDPDQITHIKPTHD